MMCYLSGLYFWAAGLTKHYVLLLLHGTSCAHSEAMNELLLLLMMMMIKS